MPGCTVVGELNVSCDFEHDESKGEDISWLIVLTQENFRTYVLAITFAFNAWFCGPSCCHTKVTYFQDTLEGDEDIGGLEV
jgi:hypothetical protein